MGQKLPSDLSANDLIKVLGKHYHYEIIQRESSHIRLCTSLKGEHSITIPDHNPIKVRTLNSILRDVALHLNISKKEIIDKLY
ncbi:MAG TPA: type II toxin-antitoxin system HicA family toxin [Candidatus Hypogeohydataceae bacterium YC41]